MLTDTITEFVEEVDCPLCGKRSYNVLRAAQYPTNLSRKELLAIYSASSDHVLLDALVRCSHCGLVYLNPRIRQDVILESYASAVDPQFIKQNEPRIRTFRRSLDYLTRRHGLKASRDTRVLDVGCAGGAFPKAAADAGFSVIGVEPSKWLSEQGRLNYGLDIRTGVLGEQSLPSSSFDLITLWDVIEHLTGPSDVVTDIHRLLKPDGLFLVNYPDHASWARRILGYRWPFFLSVHLIYFTPKTITRFLHEHGFEVQEIRPFWQTLQLGYVLKRASGYFRIFGLLEKCARGLGIYTVPLRYNIGQSFLVAKKRR